MDYLELSPFFPQKKGPGKPGPINVLVVKLLERKREPNL